MLLQTVHVAFLCIHAAPRKRVNDLNLAQSQAQALGFKV